MKQFLTIVFTLLSLSSYAFAIPTAEQFAGTTWEGQNDQMKVKITIDPQLKWSLSAFLAGDTKEQTRAGSHIEVDSYMPGKTVMVLDDDQNNGWFSPLEIVEDKAGIWLNVLAYPTLALKKSNELAPSKFKFSFY